MAQIAKTGAGKATVTAKDATDNVTELGRRTADQVTEVSREAAERTENAARHGVHVVQQVAETERATARRSVEGTTELGRMFVELASQQTQQNLETLKALSGAVDWNRFIKAVDWQQVLEIQSAYLRASLERTAQLTRRYVEVSQAVMTSAASAQRQANKVA